MLGDGFLFDVEFGDLIRAILLGYLFKGLLSMEELSKLHVCLAKNNHALTFVVTDGLSSESPSMCKSF